MGFWKQGYFRILFGTMQFWPQLWVNAGRQQSFQIDCCLPVGRQLSFQINCWLPGYEIWRRQRPFQIYCCLPTHKYLRQTAIVVIIWGKTMVVANRLLTTYEYFDSCLLGRFLGKTIIVMNRLLTMKFWSSHLSLWIFGEDNDRHCVVKILGRQWSFQVDCWLPTNEYLGQTALVVNIWRRQRSLQIFGEDNGRCKSTVDYHSLWIFGEDNGHCKYLEKTMVVDSYVGSQQSFHVDCWLPKGVTGHSMSTLNCS